MTLENRNQNIKLPLNYLRHTTRQISLRNVHINVTGLYSLKKQDPIE